MNPLDQLADIQIPNDVSIWPLAWGYWVLIALVISIVVTATLMIMRHQQWHKIKREALKSLNNINQDHAYFEQKLQVLLKSLCAHYFNDRQALKNKTLHSQQWQAFLLAQYKGQSPDRLKLALAQLHAAMYQPSTQSQQNAIEKDELKSAISDWIKTSIRKKYLNAKYLNAKYLNPKGSANV